MVSPVFAAAGAILAIGGHCHGACTVQIALGTVLRFVRYVCTWHMYQRRLQGQAHVSDGFRAYFRLNS